MTFESAGEARLFWRFARARGARRGGGWMGSGDDADATADAADAGGGRGTRRGDVDGFGTEVTGEGFYARASCEHCVALGLRAREFVTWDALKEALRRRALEWHPDRHADAKKAAAEVRFKRVYDAYDALSALRG